MHHARRASYPSLDYSQDNTSPPPQPQLGHHQQASQPGMPQHHSFQTLYQQQQQQQQLHQHIQYQHQQQPPPPPNSQQQQKQQQPQQQPPLMHEHLQYPTHPHHAPHPTKGNSGAAFGDRPPPSSTSGNKLMRSHSHTLSHSHLQLPPHHNYASPPPPHPSQQQKIQKQQQHQQQSSSSMLPFHGQPMHPSMSLPIHSMTSPPTSMHDDYHQQQQQQQAEATMESDDSASDSEACVGGIHWTRQEDNLLREAAAKFSGKAWKRIAEYCFPDGSRDKDQCLQRWRMISKPRSIKGPWTPEEDRQLRNLVKELGAEKWVLIASRLGSRTGKQCRERWHNHLDPSIDKSPFTAKEDELIFKLFEQFGSKWAEMSKLMPGRPDNAIKNHFNTSMQRKRRRLSLQDPSELQMKLHDNSSGSTTANISPLASPTSATSPTVLSRNHRFDPYERRHSMPSLEMAAKAHAGFQAAHAHSAQENQHEGPQTSRSVLTPPITPDTKGKIQFSPSMSRSISMGSNVRSASGNYPPHNKSLQGPSPGQTRPNLPGNPSIHKSNGPYYPSTSAAMATSVSSPSTSSLGNNMQNKMIRSSSAMAVSGSSGAVPPYNGHPMERGYGNYHQEHQLNHSLPRPNMTRHESLGHHPSRQSQHEQHRSLDIDPFSALAELANLAEQHREMPVRDRPTTVIVQSKEEPAEYGHEGEYGGLRRASMSVISDRNNDIEDAVMSTKIAKPTNLTRRFSTSLSHLKEEDHSEEHQGFSQHNSQQAHHSYHIDQRPGLDSIQAGRRHSLSPTSGMSPPTYFRSGRSSVDYSHSEHGSDRDQDDMEMDHDVQRQKQASPKPNAAYLAIRRGSVRELMAIDNLCLSSEEMERR